MDEQLADCREVFCYFDSRGDEKISVQQEFVEGLSHFDKEGNGLINVAELRHLLTTLGERLSDEEVDQLLAGHNDSHGNVNIADFVRNVMNS
ncbi:EF hand [Necator americanus]|uniref:Myosin-2 essential light chain n=1 Tax=Necator americanus TaxID=51031 RepID=W2TC81_NECAM|nr:EF hand [Necator americanus]ETN78771.1 EF hand [Necator americanus]